MIATEKYFKSYKDAGFHFPTTVLSTYALSLKTKPFVILSGISGTGKTKIAQLFKVPSNDKDEAKKVMVDVPLLSIKVSKEFGRFNFPQELLPNLLTSEELKDFNERAEDYRKRGDGGNFSNTYILSIDDDFGEFKLGFYGQRASSPLVRGRYYKSARDKISPDYDARNHLITNYKQGDVLEFEKIGDKRYKVVSVNKVEVQRKQRDFELKTIERHCFISVRSDWTDNNELLGFYNLIEQKYHVPSFLEFVLKARNNPEYPFFVLLDEMNLSKVEHYFSDILSCSESRIKVDDNISQENIVLHNGVDKLETDSDNFEFIPNTIEIPLNLFITGTVNIDESTYVFSPKVLDRANVIEFNEVDLLAYEKGISEDDESFKLKLFPDFSDFDIPSKKHYDSLDTNVKKYLIDLNNILKKHNLHFGYRIVNEIGLYMHNTKLYVGEEEDSFIKALDLQLIQKVFPKLNGEYAALEEPLKEVMLYLSGEDKLSNIKAENTKFPNTINKLQRMYDKLVKTGYSSFIE